MGWCSDGSPGCLLAMGRGTIGIPASLLMGLPYPRLPDCPPPPLPCPAGEWNGTTTAVKVLEHQEAEGGGQLLEALLSAQISHPNVVRERLKGKSTQLSTRGIPV